MSDPPELAIDGKRVWSLETFYDEVSRSLIPGARWGRNLDAFNDILRGGFGTPEDGFLLRWKDADHSRQFLGYPETIRQLELRLKQSHSTNIPGIIAKIDKAKHSAGPTVFDWLVDIIRDHGEGGDQAEDNVRLVLD